MISKTETSLIGSNGNEKLFYAKRKNTGTVPI